MLVYARHSVWIDQWELNAGDSLIDRVQEAIGEADALIVVLSSRSIGSEWCRKELNSGLVREIEEKRAIIIPCVIDDIEIPLFLKEKLYVDFRKGFDSAFGLLDRSLSRISNPAQSRVEKLDYHTDWSLDWGELDSKPLVEWIFVEHGPKQPYSILIRVRLMFESIGFQELKELAASGQHASFAADFLEAFLKQKSHDYRVTISDEREVSEEARIFLDDGKQGKISVGIRRLGNDNGMDTFLQVDNIFNAAINHSRSASRWPTIEYD